MHLGCWARLFVILALTTSAAVACGADDGRAPGSGSPDSGAPAVPLCVDGKAVDWPPGPYELGITSTLPPDLSFDGPAGPVRIRDYFEPCASRSRLLVVRTSAAWCGTCVWHAEHTRRLLDDPRFIGRLLLIDLLVADEDNMPPEPAAAARWRTRIDLSTKVALDSKYTFAKALLSRSPLPTYILVDTRSMTIQGIQTNPAPEFLQNDIALTLALLDGQPRPELASPVLFDGLFSEDEEALLRGMKIPGAPPPDPTNEYGDLPAAAAFGKTLFEDTSLSPAGISCAKCHDPAKAFADALPQSMGVGKVDRNSPAIALAAHARWQFWDGRADTLWMQALLPPENAVEMASSRLYVAHQVAEKYKPTYTAVFGAKYPFPDLADAARFPPNAKPGDPAWTSMAEADRDAITRIYVNIGKAMAAFERSLRVLPNALDRYADGDVAALNKAQKAGLKQFFINGCAQCHWGSRLTDDAFHAVRFPTGRQDGTPDRGRVDALASLSTGEFVATSKWSDAPGAARPLFYPEVPSMTGAFKTPSLRGIAQTAPYGHGGTMPTLLEVSKHYGTRGEDVKDDRAIGVVEEWMPLFDANAQAALPSLLELLSAEVVVP